MNKEDFEEYAKPLENAPQPLPVGVTEFEEFVQRIKSKVNLPNIPDDDLRFVLSSEILHAPGRSDRYPDSMFVAAIRRSAANQVASQVFQDVKNRQKAAEEAAKKASETKVEAEISNILTTIAEATTSKMDTASNAGKPKTKKARD